MPFDPVALLGTGYDSVTQNFTGASCADSTAPEEYPSPGRTKDFAVALATDRSELLQAIEGSVDASWFLSSGGLSFARTNAYSDTSLTLVARAAVTGATKVLRIQQLTAPVRETLKANPAAFRKQCGTAFVAGFEYQSRYVALIKMRATSSSQYASLAARVQLATGPFSARGEASSRLSEALAGQRYEASITKEGGGDSTKFSPYSEPPEKLIADMWDWLGTISTTNAVVSAVLTREYTSLNDAALLLPSDDAIVRQERFLSDAGQKYAACDTARERLQFLQSIEQDVGRRGSLATKAATAVQVRDQIYTVSEACRKDVTNCSGTAAQCDVSDFGWWQRCTKPVFAEGTGRVCGVRYKSGQGEVCGWEPGRFKEGNGPPCPPTTQRQLSRYSGHEIDDKRIAELLGEAYVARTHRTRCHSRSEACTEEDVVDRTCHEYWGAKAAQACRGISGGDSNVECWYRPYCRDINRVGQYSCDCRHFATVTIGYETCRDAGFGKEYKSCEHESFGTIELTCRHPAFGLERCESTQ